MSSSDVSPCPTPVGTPISTQAPKYGTVIPNRIFVGGITTTTTEAELKAFFTSYGTVKDTKIIADRGGVSKGYGFVTFENQEDADRILKKEAENLIFKDRKLNIGPAIRKQVHMTTQLLADLYAQGAAEQVSPRSYGDPNLHPGTVLLSTNGVPYTYQNGMAIFHASESGYPIAQPQPAYSTAAVMVSQPPPPVYMAPTYPTYQPGTPPQWTAPTPSQWRWTAQVFLTHPTVMTATIPTYQNSRNGNESNMVPGVSVLSNLTYAAGQLKSCNSSLVSGNADEASREISCSIDTSNKDVTKLALCPWTYTIDRDVNRVPRDINVAKCMCGKCAGMSNFLKECRAIYKDVPVFRLNAATGLYQSELQMVPVACGCGIYSEEV